MNTKLVNILSFIMLFIILISLFQIGGEINEESALTDNSAMTVEEEAQRIYGGYIDIVARQIESRIDSVFNELAILRSIQQTYIDNSLGLESVTDALKSNMVTTDSLTYNGKWYQNGPGEQNVVMVHRHLLDDNGQIKAEVQRDLDNTIILDLVLESFHRNGVEKQLTYTQGGLNKSFTRMYPWVDLGTLFYEVYPAFIDTNIWEAFNPGLVAAFEKRMLEEVEVKEDPNSLARVLLPVQDGVTGEVIMTFTSPLFDPERKMFRGTVAFDVNMTDVIDLIEALNVSEEGFTFLSQSTGNIFAINELGAQTLGFSQDLDSLEITGEGVGFNRLERILEESSYESVQNLSLPVTDKAEYEIINIEGQNYMVVMQKLKPFQIWVPNDWFRDESWTVGLVIPESEIVNIENEAKMNGEDNQNTLYIVLSGLAAVILFGLSYSKGVNGKKSSEDS